MKYPLITLLLLNTFLSFSQTPFENKISELNIGPYQHTSDYNTLELASGDFGQTTERNHLNSRRNFGLFYFGIWANSRPAFSTNIEQLIKSFVLFTFPNSIGGLVQNPLNQSSNPIYGAAFDVYIYDGAGNLISFFSSTGNDADGSPISASSAAHHYYQNFYLNDSSVSSPFDDDKKWGASFATQAIGSTLKVVFDFKGDWWMNGLYDGTYNNQLNVETYSSDNGVPRGFYIETTVSDNTILPYTKYNPWNDEVFGIVQTDSEIRIKDESDNILVSGISTGSSSYDLPIAVWDFSHTLASSLAPTEDVVVKLETKYSPTANYSSSSKTIIYTANKSSIDYFNGDNLLPKDSSSEVVINTKQDAPNLTYTEINRFSFDRTSSIDDISNMTQTYNNYNEIGPDGHGDPDAFWLGTDLAYANANVATFNNKDPNWILPTNREQMPVTLTNRQNEDWYGDIRPTESGSSTNGYAQQKYIGINKIYALDTGDFTPWIDVNSNAINIINGLGLSTANITQNWSYKNGQSSFSTNQTVKFNVFGIRAKTNFNANLNNNGFGSFFSYYDNDPKPWSVNKLDYVGGDSPVDYSSFSDPDAVENTFSYSSSDFDPRENFYWTHLVLTEINGSFREMKYDDINLNPSSIQELESFPYPSWKVVQNSTDPFQAYWQRPITDELLNIYLNQSLNYLNPNPAKRSRFGDGVDSFDNYRNYAIRTSLPFAPQPGTQVVYDIVVNPHNKPNDSDAQLDQDYFVYNANTSTHTNPSRQLIFDENNWDEGQFVSFWNRDNDSWDGALEYNLGSIPKVDFQYVINNDLTTDPNYLNAGPIDDNFYLRDDDQPGLHLDVNVENIEEGSTPYTIRINEGETQTNAARLKLTAKPYQNVTVIFEVPNDGSEVYFDPPAPLTFTPENWNVFQDFNMTCKQEDYIQKDRAYTIKVKFQNPEAFHLSNTKVYDPNYEKSFLFRVINDDIPVSVIKLDNNGALEDFSSLSLYEGGLTTETPQGPTEASIGIFLETPLAEDQEVYYNIYVADADGAKNDALYKDLTQPMPYAFEVAAGVSNPKWSDTDNDGWRDFQEDRDKDGVYNSPYRLFDDYSNFNDPGSWNITTPDPSVVDKIENHKLIAQLTFTSANYNTPQYVTVSAVEDGIVDGDQTMGLFFDVDIKTTNDYDNIPITQKELIVKDSDTPDLDLDDELDETDTDDDGDGCPDVDDDLPRDNSTCEDFDLDGISDADDPDDDGDGVADQIELDQGTDPFDICSFPEILSFRWPDNFSSVAQIDHFMSLDCDGDGYTNGQEYFNQFSAPDSSLDLFNGPSGLTVNNDLSYLLDYCEIPQNQRNDNYTLSQGTPSEDWNSADCDNDGQTNAEEITLGSDPYDEDTDNDGINDLQDLCDNTPYGASTDANGCSLVASWFDSFSYSYEESQGSATLNWMLQVSGQNTTSETILRFSNPFDSRVSISDGGSGVLVYESFSWNFTIPAGD